MMTIVFLTVITAQNLAAQPASVITVGELLEQGKSLAAVGNYAEARTIFTKAIEIDPSEADAYGYRGMTNRRLRNYAQAIEDFKKVLQLGPQDRGYIELGLTYYEMKEYQSAIYYYTKAIDANPRYRDAYDDRGNTYVQLGNTALAIQDFNTAIEIDPKDKFAHYYRALAYQRTGNTSQYKQDMKVAADLGMALAKDTIDQEKVTSLRPDASSTANVGAAQNARQAKQDAEIRDKNEALKVELKKYGAEALVPINLLEVNPYEFEGHTIAVVAQFKKMLSKNSASFYSGYTDLTNYTNVYDEIIVTKIPDGAHFESGLFSPRMMLVLKGKGAIEGTNAFGARTKAPYFEWIGIISGKQPSVFEEQRDVSRKNALQNMRNARPQSGP